MMSDKANAMRKLSAAGFAMWEVNMYLDTHPHDESALSALDKYKLKYKELKSDYEEKYGPLGLDGKKSSEWVSDPWPWDYIEEE